MNIPTITAEDHIMAEVTRKTIARPKPPILSTVTPENWKSCLP